MRIDPDGKSEAERRAFLRCAFSPYLTAVAHDDPLRVLCVTSRFTTFLKYSTRDVAATLERQGMATRLLIEPKDYAVVSPQAYMEAFVEFQKRERRYGGVSETDERRDEVGAPAAHPAAASR